MSLQDQLLKAGLTSKDNHQKVRTDKRKQRKSARQKGGKDQDDAQLSPEETQARQQASEARAKKVAKDRALNQQKEQQRKQGEQLARIVQLIDQHQIEEAQWQGEAHEAESVYRFTMDKAIRELSVKATVRQQIINGVLGIVRRQPGESGAKVQSIANQIAIIPRQIAQAIQAENDEFVVVLNALESRQSQENDTSEKSDKDDPYAGYEVPDDLMW